MIWLRRCRNALLIPIAAWLTVCLVMYLQQRQMVYFGAATRVDVASTNFALPREHGLILRGWVVNPDAPDVLLYFGGNGEQVGQMRDALAAWLPQRASYLMAYRGYGASDGEPSEQRLFADALALYDEAVRRHPRARVAVIGRSLGSGVAAYLAAHRPVERLVLLTPFDSLVNVAGSHYPWLPVNLLMTERYESIRWLRGYRQPVLVIRAGRDQIVPPVSTDRLIQALSPPPQVFELPQADHNDVLQSQRERDALIRFIAPPPL